MLENLVWILAFKLTRWKPLDKIINLSTLQFTHLYNGENKIHITVWKERLIGGHHSHNYHVLIPMIESHLLPGRLWGKAPSLSPGFEWGNLGLEPRAGSLWLQSHAPSHVTICPVHSRSSIKAHSLCFSPPQSVLCRHQPLLKSAQELGSIKSHLE